MTASRTTPPRQKLYDNLDFQPWRCEAFLTAHAGRFAVAMRTPAKDSSRRLNGNGASDRRDCSWIQRAFADPQCRHGLRGELASISKNGPLVVESPPGVLGYLRLTSGSAT